MTDVTVQTANQTPAYDQKRPADQHATTTGPAFAGFRHPLVHRSTETHRRCRYAALLESAADASLEGAWHSGQHAAQQLIALLTAETL